VRQRARPKRVVNAGKGARGGRAAGVTEGCQAGRASPSFRPASARMSAWPRARSARVSLRGSTNASSLQTSEVGAPWADKSASNKKWTSQCVPDSGSIAEGYVSENTLGPRKARSAPPSCCRAIRRAHSGGDSTQRQTGGTQLKIHDVDAVAGTLPRLKPVHIGESAERCLEGEICSLSNKTIYFPQYHSGRRDRGDFRFQG